MPKFSEQSKARLATCHPDLQRVFNEVIKHVDCTIIEGVRSINTQKEYVRTGKSKTMDSEAILQIQQAKAKDIEDKIGLDDEESASNED